MILIGLLGYNGAGKDTVADYLVQHHKFQKIAFGDALKDAVASIFGWDRQLLQGDTVQSRQWRETVDDYWQTTPRKVLETFGTDVCRQHYDTHLWIKSLHKKLLNMINNNEDAHIVVTDCRFDNEIQLIKQLNGYLIRIERDPQPVWKQYIDLYYQKVLTQSEATIQLVKHTHCSQWLSYFSEIQPDFILQNQKSIDDLYIMIEAVVDQIELL